MKKLSITLFFYFKNYQVLHIERFSILKVVHFCIPQYMPKSMGHLIENTAT